MIRLRSGGWVRVDRSARRAVFSLASAPPPAALVHPHLAAVALAQAHWSGHESFHAGGFVADGGVWGVLGDKGAGKSSLLATLAAQGVAIMCDDVLVLDGHTALAGPRLIDLRESAARQFRSGVELGVIGGRERWRVTLSPVPAELPFRGWIELQWGPEVRVAPKRGADRLKALFPHRGLRVVPSRPEQLIALAGMPVLELFRPPEWNSHQEAIDALLQSVAGAGQPR